MELVTRAATEWLLTAESRQKAAQNMRNTVEGIAAAGVCGAIHIVTEKNAENVSRALAPRLESWHSIFAAATPLTQQQ